MAQDKIFKKNGEVIDAKLSLINSEIVVFKRYDNPNGPEYTIPKGDVAKIKYSNGTQDIFEENNDRIGVAKGKENVRSYSEVSRNKNIIALAPLQFTDHGYGLGLSWEHTLDQAGWISMNIPAIVTWNFVDPSVTKRDAMFYLMPGAKVYTNLNGPQKDKFSIGPSLLMGVGSGTPFNHDLSEHMSHFELGALANFGFNVFPAPHIYIGGDFGLGFTYLNQYDNKNYGTEFLFEFSFKIGYRYQGKAKG
jgi:hypothetical protein